MGLKFNGKAVMRTGQRLALQFKTTVKQKKEDKVRTQSISQEDQARWTRLVTLVEMFFFEQVAISGKEDFKLSGSPKTELNIDTQEKALLTALFKVIVLHFNTGRDVSSVKEFQLPTNAKDREFARDTIERLRDQDKKWLSEQPGPAPSVLLAKTESQERIDKHYADDKNVITDERSGRESFLPPPCLLAPLTQEEREAIK